MPERVVLVTGGAGFIGSRVVEMLHQRGVAVRAGVHTWKSAARVGRLPVDIVPCDVTDPAQLRAAMDGVREVVHCARGGGEVNIEGTRNVLDAALAAGVGRLVHISTVAVYGEATGAIDEATARQQSGSEYGDSKIETERLCAEYQARGLSTCVLRPTIVYGPFSASWTVEFAQRFTGGRWQLPRRTCEGTCNLVYVDDLVDAILLALEREEADGQTFLVNGPDRPTWWEYFDALNTAMGRPPLDDPNPVAARLAASLMMPVRKTAKFALTHFQSQIMGLYQRSAAMKRLMKRFEKTVRNTPTTNEFELYGRRLSFSTARAERLLGYRPRVDMGEGIRRSVAWLRHHRYV